MRERLVRGLRLETARAALGGVLLAVGAPPFPPALIGASFAGVVLLASAVREATVRQGAVRALFFGLFTNLIAMSFVPSTITRFTDLPMAAALLGWVLLSLGQGAAWAVAFALSSALRRFIAFPIAFAAAIGVSMLLPSLFPWTIAAPYARAPVFLQLAEVIGERGMAVVIALAAAFAAEGFADVSRRRRHLATSAAIVLVMLGYGVARRPAIDAAIAAAPKRTVGLVQQNVPPKERWEAHRAPEIVVKLWALTKLAQDHGADLVIWPESAYPYVIPHAPSQDGGPFRIRGPGVSAEVLTGLLSAAPPPEQAPDENARNARWHYNAAAIVDREGRISQPAAKLELLAFGETVPLGERFPALRRIFARGGGLRPGLGPVLLTTQSAPIVRSAILNCYEDTLPSVLRRVASLAPDGRGPNLLVNLTNDAWFGKTAEPELHLLESIPRAIEARRDLVRAVNTGVTVHVDAFGRVVARAPREVTTLLVVTPALLEGVPTLYVRFGDATWGAALLLAAAVSTAMRRRNGS